MNVLLLVGLFVISYLLGSIPTAVWVGKKFFDIDIREHGSKNAGATNTIRVLGWKAGGPVFLIDLLKGFAAASLIHFTEIEHGTNAFINAQLAMGFAALLGHVFPVFANFRGGKGVATLLGVVIALSPLAAVMAFGVFLIMLIIFKYVSLGSMIAGISYTFFIWFLLVDRYPFSLKIASTVMALALIATHKKNIVRLVKGEESKAGFLYKKK
jgi:acyl phosphate:glycerol-3-phosphate acyltransferase